MYLNAIYIITVSSFGGRDGIFLSFVLVAYPSYNNWKETLF